MLQKLYAVVSGACCADNPDSPQHQEVLLSGFLYSMIIKERLEEALTQVRNQIAMDVRKDDPAVNFVDSKWSLPSSYLRLLTARSDSLRTVSYEGVIEGWLGYRFQNVEFPCHRQPSIANWSRPSASFWFHHCCREVKLATIYQSFQMYPSWCILCRTQNYHCAKAASRSLGFVQ